MWFDHMTLAAFSVRIGDESFEMMQALMCGASVNLKIGRIVIQSIFILVVNYLPHFKLSTKNGFHHGSMVQYASRFFIPIRSIAAFAGESILCFQRIAVTFPAMIVFAAESPCLDGFVASVDYASHSKHYSKSFVTGETP